MNPFRLNKATINEETLWHPETDLPNSYYDYFIAENPRGETVWIYRDHRYGTDDGEWFLHGLFA